MPIKDSWLFSALWLLLLILYIPAGDGKFVNDTFYYLNEIEQTGAKGILNSYNMIFLWHLPSLAYYLLYKAFGLNWLGWHAVFTAFHALNAMLLTGILRRFLPAHLQWTAFAGAFLFLISPYQTEVVAWGATFHYLLILTFLLTGIRAMIFWLDTRKAFHLLVFHLSFLLSLWCFEQAFLYPIIFGLIYLLFFHAETDEEGAFKDFAFRFLLGNVMMIALYFLLTKWIYGVWIAHYGAKTHAVMDWKVMYDCLIHYTAKFLIFFRDLPGQLRHFIQQPFVFSAISILLPVVISGTAIGLARAGKFAKLEWRMLAFLCLAYGLMLVPVLNLDQSFTFEIQSDRYGYIASAFFYPGLALLLGLLLNRAAANALLGLYMVVSCALLWGNNTLWGHSGRIGMELIRNYPLADDQQALLLNLPDNYRGAYMFRNGFPEGLNVTRGGNHKPSISFAARVNILSDQNETSVLKLRDRTWYVKCEVPGKWYYHLGQGAYDYHKDLYSVDFDEWNSAYELTIEELKDTVWLLQCAGTQWVVVDTLFPAVSIPVE